MDDRSTEHYADAIARCRGWLLFLPPLALGAWYLEPLRWPYFVLAAYLAFCAWRVTSRAGKYALEARRRACRHCLWEDAGKRRDPEVLRDFVHDPHGHEAN